MKLKTIIVCVAVLAVVSAIAFYARRPGSPPSNDPRIGQPIANAGVVDKAAKLRISDQGKTVLLARDANGTWRDTNYFDLPADFSKLSSFVGNLTDAKIDRLVTSNPDRVARLEFKDTKIELLDSTDKPVWSLTLGKSSETGGRFVRFDDERKAYLATLNAWLDTEPKNWANAELINVKPEDVAAVEVEFPAPTAAANEPAKAADAKFTLTREKKDAAWSADHTPAEHRVKPDTVSSLINSLGTFRFSDTSDPSDPNVAAAKAHVRTFKLTTFDKKTYTIAIGRKPEEKKPKPAAPKSDDAPKKDEAAAKSAKSDAAEKKAEESKPAEPQFETVPAGPVYVFITSSDSTAPVNALMQKRAFQIADYTFTGLPQKSDDFFEAAPPPPPAPTQAAAPAKPEEKKAGEKKVEPAKK
jgi:hypothetical protein